MGRGKTWLVDVLLAQLPPAAVLRLHAFDAARQVHRAVAYHTGRGVAVDLAVDSLLRGVRLLFVDELHAHDPGDAMVLSRLVRGLPQHGCVLVATSNYPPSGLLPDPRHHHLVLPLVAALKERCAVVELAGPVDHRAAGHGGARPGWTSGAWLQRANAAQLGSLGLAMPAAPDGAQVRVSGRWLRALHVEADEGHFTFDELCEGRTSLPDLLELAEQLRTLVLHAVPSLAAASMDARQRFANLVDVCWDRDVRLVVVADCGRDEVMATSLPDAARTASRLMLLGGC